MTRSKTKLLVPAIIICLMGLAGCSGPSANQQGTLSISQATCGDWKKSDGDLAMQLGPLSDIASYEKGSAKLYFSSDFFDKFCGRASEDSTLAEVQEEYGSAPTCESFLAATDFIKPTWIAVGIDQFSQSNFNKWWTPGQQRSLLIRACTEHPDLAFGAAFDWLDMSNLPDLFSGLEDISVAGWDHSSWNTISKLGFSYDSRLYAGPAEAGLKTYPGTEGWTLGQSCGFDPDTDIAVPLKLIVENSTSTESANLTSEFVVAWEGLETVELKVEAQFASGPECITPQGSSMQVGFAANSVVAPGSQNTCRSFLILSNYYSPRYPDGNTADLERITIRGHAYADDSDPVVSFSGSDLRLTAPSGQDSN